MITGTLIYTWLNGRQVGVDSYGNRYYESRKALPGTYRPRRWVLYKGAMEASKVPAEWHAWLHHTTETPIKAEQRAWEKEHQPNLSGSVHAYLPPGHLARGGERDRATGDYEPWTPA
jgi:NADH:ubiquinone oxidoreductase subunit